jgi:hypothetical protein
MQHEVMAYGLHAAWNSAAACGCLATAAAPTGHVVTQDGCGNQGGDGDQEGDTPAPHKQGVCGRGTQNSSSQQPQAHGVVCLSPGTFLHAN